jgi:hypothetical protein
MDVSEVSLASINSSFDAGHSRFLYQTTQRQISENSFSLPYNMPERHME